MANCCPVCGFGLGFRPWNEDSPSDEICPCCGIQFGYSDCAGGDINRRQQLYREWRERWIGQGMQWKSVGERPAGWNAVQQLQNIGVAAPNLIDSNRSDKNTA